MSATRSIITTLLVAAAAASWAQNPPPGGPREQPQPGMAPQSMPMGSSASRPRGGAAGDPMTENFFPPELIMQNQGALGLSAEQKTAIREAMQKSMAQFTDLQWQQSSESEAMNALLKQERVDETNTLAQLDKLVKIENEIKRMHLSLMIRIKNMLTPEQQTKLREMKRSAGPSGPHGMGAQGRQGPRMPPGSPPE